jgi:hypothetical protein
LCFVLRASGFGLRASSTAGFELGSATVRLSGCSLFERDSPEIFPCRACTGKSSTALGHHFCQSHGHCAPQDDLHQIGTPGIRDPRPATGHPRPASRDPRPDGSFAFSDACALCSFGASTRRALWFQVCVFCLGVCALCFVLRASCFVLCALCSVLLCVVSGSLCLVF